MYKAFSTKIKSGLLLIPIIALTVACNYSHPQLTYIETTDVQHSVNKFMADIATDVTAKGPVIWLDRMDHSPGFFMANDGKLAFKNDTAAVAFINDTLVKSVKSIKLKWANVRIDALTNNIAAIGADYHEDVVDTAGKPTSFGGYFTATALKTGDEWKIRNMHWSEELKK